MLPSWYEIPAAGAELLRTHHRITDIDSPPIVGPAPHHLMTSIETFLDDTSEMELDGSFLTYSDMDLSTDRSEKHHQVVANTTFISPPDTHRHRRIYPKFESTRFLPLEPMLSVTVPYNNASVDISECTSPLSISSWELETRSDDLVAPPNSPNMDEPEVDFEVNPTQNFTAAYSASDNIQTKCPSCGSLNACSCDVLAGMKSTKCDHVERNMPGVTQKASKRADFIILGERLPCDGMESAASSLQAPTVLPPSATVKPQPQRNVHSKKNIINVVTKPEKFGAGKSQKCTGKRTQADDSRPQIVHRLLSTVVECSMVSLPSNMDSDDDVVGRFRHGVTNTWCDKPLGTCVPPFRAAKKSKSIHKSTASSRKRNFAGVSEKCLPYHMTESCDKLKQISTRLSTHDTGMSRHDLSFVTPQEKLSCSVSSDATCFMARPLCRGGVTTRGQYMSHTRQTILSRKLKQIGRYLRRSNGAGRTHLIPELQTLGVV